MKLTTTFSKSGKTMYYAVKLDDNYIIKAQSKLKAVEILSNLTASSVVSLAKVKRNWFLIIDGNSFGRLTKTDFLKLQNYLTKTNEITYNEFQIHDTTIETSNQITHQSQLPLLGGNGYSSQWDEKVLHGGLQYRSGDIDFIFQSDAMVLASSESMEYFRLLDTCIRADESSPNQFVRQIATCYRSQLELAFKQRATRDNQQGIRDNQQGIRDNQQGIRRTLIDSIGSACKFLSPDSLARFTQIASSRTHLLAN
jgi:hypothetical protein